MNKLSIKSALKKIGFVLITWRLLLKLKRSLRKLFLENSIFYKINYINERMYNTYMTKVSYNHEIKVNPKTIKTVALIYSRMHFDPKNDEQNKKYSQSSAANIARNIYCVFSSHNVIYTDKDEKIDKVPKADLVIGVVSQNFVKISRANPQALKILFLVNCHPLYRAEILLKESHELRRGLHRQECINSLFFLKAQKYADRLILIGNEFVKNTYIEYGSCPEKLFLINSGVNLENLTPNFSKRPDGKIRIIYSASDLGIRKGLFRVIQYWEALNFTSIHNVFELKIIGGGATFNKEIEEFVRRFNNVEYLGWIDSTKQEYINILQSSHIILFPSLEEGQAGTVLEAMACGCVPIITEQSGIPITDREGFVIKDYTNTNEVIDYMNILSENKPLITTMSTRSRNYIEKNHDWKNFRENFIKIAYK